MTKERTKELTKELVSKLCSGSRVDPVDLSTWLLESKVYFDRPVTDMSIFNDTLLPENFIEEADYVLEYYDDNIRALCKALSYAWNTDLHVSLVIIGRLTTWLTYNFTGDNVSYDIIMNKLGLLLYLSEL